MEPLIIACVGLLGLLAVFDLYVGVSNDAVNFLNSAVGSRTAPIGIILAVASAGVILGAAFSSGMMDIAKTGVLVPSAFTFREVLVIFSAVMVTDVLLLNAFNSFGLPTSTTVSIVFELLGGTAALAALKVWTGDLPVSSLESFVNSSKSLSMIMAILVSVAVAFVSGLVVQFFCRLIFTFNYQCIYRILGGVFGGFCVTAIIYFLVMKGLKGASFATPEMLDFVKTNEAAILWCAFIGTSAIMQTAIWLRAANIFPFVILAGTFALSFAFAGNDLVNFVGVPLAALDAWHIFAASNGADPETMKMGALAEPSTANSVWLLLSGAAMAATLWISKKARRVIMTSVKLSSSSRGGKEQFGSSLPARILVRASIRFSEGVERMLPKSALSALAGRYEPRRYRAGEKELPFDEVRASINLVLAAALIASATSLQLPLSTTYVTFMVAMGSSLADGAWNRESAVYRVSGVLTVITGWFFTAFAAAAACAAVAVCFFCGGYWLMIAGMIAAGLLLVKSNFFTEEKNVDLEEGRTISACDCRSIYRYLAGAVERCGGEAIRLTADGIDGLLGEDVRALKILKNRAATLFDEVSAGRGDYYAMALSKDAKKADRDARNFYYRAFTNMKEVTHALRDQIGLSENYVANSHSAMTGLMARALADLSAELKTVEKRLTKANAARIGEIIERAQNDYMEQAAQEKVSLRKSELYLGTLIFTREMVNRFAMVEFLLEDLEKSKD